MVDREREQQIVDAVSHLLGPVESIVYQPFGHAGITYEIAVNGLAYIVKTSDRPGTFDHTLLNMRILRTIGVPTPDQPQVRRVDDIDYLIYSKIPGRDLRYELPEMTREQMTRLAEAIVTMQRAVTKLWSAGRFGWAPIGVPADYENWMDVIGRDSVFASSSVLAAISEIEPYLRAHAPTCFLDDVTVKNVIVDKGELAGIVDLDFVCFGDPMYWLSLAETTVVLDVGFEALYYTEEIKRFCCMTPQEERACAVYSALHADNFLRHAGNPSEDPWVLRLQQWMSKCIALCA